MASCMTDSYKVHSCAQKRFHDKNDFEVEPSEKQRITITGDKPVRKSNKENSLCRNNVTIKTKESYSDDLKKHEKKAPKHEKVKHEFLDKLYEIMLRDGFMKARDRNERVLEFTHPEDLRKKIDFDLGSKTSDEKILSLCQDVIKYSVKVAHPRFFNQLYGGLDEYSLGGCWLTETLNASLYTYEVSPVFSLMERVVIDKMLGKIGFEDGDAMFCPGGSISNMYALNIARYFMYPEIKKKGIRGIPDICAFTSEKCHYSMAKGVAFMGMGLDNLISVKTDAKGKMIPEDLEKKILEAKEQGKTPYFVNATAGTTVLGAFDPIDDIADICKKHGLWMHVDGAWGGGALLSKTYRSLLRGVERADSMTWNPHKLMGVPQQCSLVFTRHKGLLEQCHSANAAYLFQQDKFYDVSYDSGDKSIQCGRKNDVLKLWIMWKNKGDEGFEKDIDNQFECAKYLAELVKQREGFELISEPECTNVCFYYIPERLRGKERTSEWWNEISKVGPKVKEGMMKAGSMMVGYQPDGDLVNFFRMIISNLDIVKSDMEFVVDEIERLGKNL